MRRRSLLKLAAALGTAILLPERTGLPGRLGSARFVWRPATARADSLDEQPPVRAAEWASEPDPGEDGYVSPPYRTAFPFDALAVRWQARDRGPWTVDRGAGVPVDPAAAAEPALWLRTSRDGWRWTDWRPQAVFAERHGERFGRLLDLAEPAEWVQYAVGTPSPQPAPSGRGGEPPFAARAPSGLGPRHSVLGPHPVGRVVVTTLKRTISETRSGWRSA